MQFQDDVEMLEELLPAAHFPALVLNDNLTIPVSLSVFFGAAWRGLHLSPWRPTPRWLRPVLELYDEDHLSRMTGHAVMTIKEARRSFVDNATKSLAHRIAAVTGSGRDNDGSTSVTLPPTRGGSPTATAGCRFEVTSNTSGLRVFWSGAYYVTSQYFGHPTSPAHAVLQAGTYIFGVDGGAYHTVQWDRNAVCSIPGCQTVHLNY